MNYFFRQYGEVANITRIQNSWALGSCSAAAFFMPAVVSMSKDLFKATSRLNATSLGTPAFNRRPRRLVGLLVELRVEFFAVTLTHSFSSKLQFMILPSSYLHRVRHPHLSYKYAFHCLRFRGFKRFISSMNLS